MPLFRVFPQHFAHQEPVTFEDLFRSVSQFSDLAESIYRSDEASPFSHCQPKQQRSARPRVFNPRFDIRETETAYELHGELPGINKEHVHIEFTEPQTMIIRGRVERTFSAGTPPAEKAVETPEKPAIADNNDDAVSVASTGSHTPAGSVSGRQASVSDEETEAAKERGEEDFTIISNENEEKKAPVAAKDTAAPTTTTKPANRFWRQERTVGEFHRQFVFNDRIDENAVSATLDNGILQVSVPKVKRETRRIAIA